MPRTIGYAIVFALFLQQNEMQKQYVQPFVIGILAGIGVGGYIFYQSLDPSKSLTVGGVAFLLLFWVVLRGNNLAKKQQSSSESNDKS